MSLSGFLQPFCDRGREYSKSWATRSLSASVFLLTEQPSLQRSSLMRTQGFSELPEALSVCPLRWPLGSETHLCLLSPW